MPHLTLHVPPKSNMELCSRGQMQLVNHQSYPPSEPCQSSPPPICDLPSFLMFLSTMSSALATLSISASYTCSFKWIMMVGIKLLQLFHREHLKQQLNFKRQFQTCKLYAWILLIHIIYKFRCQLKMYKLLQIKFEELLCNPSGVKMSLNCCSALN